MVILGVFLGTLGDVPEAMPGEVVHHPKTVMTNVPFWGGVLGWFGLGISVFSVSGPV